MFNPVVSFIFYGILGSVCVYLLLALILTFSQVSKPVTTSEGLDFSSALAAPAAHVPPLQSYLGSNDSELFFRHYPGNREGAPLLILIHGSGWHGLGMHEMAAALAQTGAADVIVPDLRGHGVKPARRGDVDWIGQFEDDLHLLILSQRRAGQPVVMAGHSSGGGLVVRFAAGQYGGDIQSAILLAPYLGYNAPTTRPNSGGWAQPLTRRIIGLTMLNAVGITVFNHLPVIDFGFPSSVLDGDLGQTATPRYSFRLNSSYAPHRDFMADIARLPRFLVLAGTQDEAFKADHYEPMMRGGTDQGQYILLDGLSHLEILHSPLAFDQMRDFLTAEGK